MALKLLFPTQGINHEYASKSSAVSNCIQTMMPGLDHLGRIHLEGFLKVVGKDYKFATKPVNRESHLAQTVDGLRKEECRRPCVAL